jgi:superfamily II DNA or RNA helicase
LAYQLHDSQLASLLDALALFSPRTQARGRDYAAAGRVERVDVRDGAIHAAVRGTREYATRWAAANGRWHSLCTCPLGGYCKHAFALGCVVLGTARARHGFDDARLATLLPGAERAASRPRRGAGDALQRLRQARAEWERQAALDALLVGAPRFGLSPYAPPLLDLIREPDPDVRCWRLADTIAALADGWVPPALAPFRGRTDLAERYVDRERALLADELLAWASHRSDVARRQLRLAFMLDPQPDGSAALVFEARVTTPRAVDMPRTLGQLQGLRSESLRDPALFPPEQGAILEWLADHAATVVRPGAPHAPRLTTALPLALLERVANSPLAIWAEDLDPALGARGGVAPGTEVRLRGGDARLVPQCLERDGGLTIELQFVWADGGARPLGEAVYVRADAPHAGRRGSLVLVDGTLTPLAEEPPRALLHRFRTLGALPIPPGERAEFVGMLASRFPHLRQTLAAHTRIHPAVPSVALDLRPDDWLQVRVFASTANAPWQPGSAPAGPAVLFEYGPHCGWVRTDAAAAATAAEPISAADDPHPRVADDASVTPVAAELVDAAAVAQPWVEMPDPNATEPVIEWLHTLPVEPGMRRGGGNEPTWPDRGVGWWMRATRRTMEQFAAGWEHRPDGVAFFGTERVRRLLTGARTIVPRLRIGGTGIDWLAVSAEWDAEGRRLSETDLARLRAATTRFVKLDAGWVRSDAGEEQEAIAAALADLGIDPDAGEQRLTIWQIAGASPATLQTLQRFGGDGETLAALQRLREQVAAFRGIPSVPVPPGVTATLRTYQRHGLDFLVNASRLGLGAVLADDMGLGKTVQALAWVMELREADPAGGPSLVVCPASVVHNWARECARFTPALRVLLLTSGKTRHALREAIPRHDLVITTYALLRRDLEAWRSVPLRAAILDEAQFIKNPDAAVSRAARELTARHRLALTGTPLENRALDLWSIMAFLNPGYLGNRSEFSARYDRADAPPHARALLAAKLRAVLLRRTKQAVAPELPPRIEERLDCELSAGQRQLYVAELQRSRALLAQIGTDARTLGRGKITILAALTRLRQICCHPALAGGRADLGSGKFDAFFELLEPILAEGHKVLVFSQFVQCLKLLAAELRARAVALHMLTGQTTRREHVVAAFQDDPAPGVFLVSLKAGGTGLNLTAASYVVLFDPWWNPAVEAQAIDRTHRIGQDRTVIAYRLLTRGTIEDKIHDLQQRKASLVRDVLGESGFARSLTRDDLEYLFADA